MAMIWLGIAAILETVALIATYRDYKKNKNGNDQRLP
jgi:hypothetical protein